MTPAVLFATKVAAFSLVAGMLMGGLAAHAVYSPRLDLAVERSRGLNDRIGEQNKAIEALQSAGAAQAKKAKTAVDAANSARRRAESRAAELMKREPPAGVDLCVAASALIREELGK